MKIIKFLLVNTLMLGSIFTPIYISSNNNSLFSDKLVRLFLPPVLGSALTCVAIEQTPLKILLSPKWKIMAYSSVIIGCYLLCDWADFIDSRRKLYYNAPLKEETYGSNFYRRVVSLFDFSQRSKESNNQALQEFQTKSPAPYKTGEYKFYENSNNTVGYQYCATTPLEQLPKNFYNTLNEQDKKDYLENLVGNSIFFHSRYVNGYLAWNTRDIQNCETTDEIHNVIKKLLIISTCLTNIYNPQALHDCTPEVILLRNNILYHCYQTYKYRTIETLQQEKDAITATIKQAEKALIKNRTSIVN